jgi:hypothetical protein
VSQCGLGTYVPGAQADSIPKASYMALRYQTQRLIDEIPRPERCFSLVSTICSCTSILHKAGVKHTLRVQHYIRPIVPPNRFNSHVTTIMLTESAYLYRCGRNCEVAYLIILASAALPTPPLLLTTTIRSTPTPASRLVKSQHLTQYHRRAETLPPLNKAPPTQLPRFRPPSCASYPNTTMPAFGTALNTVGLILLTHAYGVPFSSYQLG